MGDGARTQGNMRSTCNHSAYASDHDLVGLYTTACHLFRLTLTIQMLNSFGRLTMWITGIK